MATKTWTGRAASVAQVTKITWSATGSHTYSVTINGKTVSYTSTTSSLATIIDGLIAAWEASPEPEHAELIAAQRIESSTLVGLQLTAVASGVPHTITASATSGTATVTEITAASGPNFWNVAANWSGASLPSASDDLVFEDSAVSVLYGLTDTTNYGSLTLKASYTGAIGLPATNANGYPEYRTRFLTLGNGSGTLVVTIGEGVGIGASRVLLDLNDGTGTVTVHQTSANTLEGYPVQIHGLDSSSAVRVYGGSVQLGDPSSAAVSTLDIIERPASRARPVVSVASTVTVTTILCSGGELYLESSATSLTARDGAIVTVQKAAAIPTVKVGSRARLNWESSAGISTKLTAEPGGIADFGRVATTKTIAAADIHPGGTILDPLDKITWTAGVVLVGARLADVTLDLGFGVTVS
jgi:hypothetical protein